MAILSCIFAILFQGLALTAQPTLSQPPRLPEGTRFLQDLDYLSRGYEGQKLDLYLPRRPASCSWSFGFKAAATANSRIPKSIRWSTHSSPNTRKIAMNPEWVGRVRRGGRHSVVANGLLLSIE